VSAPARPLISLFVFLAVSIPAARSSEKYLVEFGWDEPGTAFLRQHIQTMEQTPFDGCVFHVDGKTPTGEPIRFTSNTWGRRAFTGEELQGPLEDLKSIRFKRFKHNFLRFNVTPGDVGWFDDFSPIVQNAKQAAALAKAGQCAGILFDVEAYAAPLWDYRKLRHDHAWPEYQQQARARGRELMGGFQTGFPNLTVFLTFGYSIAWVQMEHGKKPLEQCGYGLLPAFLDGMFEQAAGKTTIVDGCELAYSYKDLTLFQRDYSLMRTGVLEIVQNPKKYHDQVSAGFGLWLDFDSHKRVWDPVNLTTNYFSPAEFENSVRAALQRSDRYVWIYTEQPRWWTENGEPKGLPQQYIEAIRRARRGLCPP
jgi:hypothetical protein